MLILHDGKQIQHRDHTLIAMIHIVHGTLAGLYSSTVNIPHMQCTSHMTELLVRVCLETFDPYVNFRN